MTHKIPELINQLQFVDKDSPVYDDYKSGIQNNIKALFDSQKEQISHCRNQQKSLLQNNQDILGNCIKGIETKVAERLMPLFAEKDKQIEFTKKIEAIISEKKLLQG
jgi:hypothetical protein